MIYSHEFPHCEYASSFEEVKTKLMYLLQKSLPNERSANYVHTTYRKSRITEQILDVYKRLGFDQ